MVKYYSNTKIARLFWVFGLSAFVGCVLGFIIGSIYLPTFYQKQVSMMLPELKVQFHPFLVFTLIDMPTIVFVIISMLFAYLKLKNPVFGLLHEKQNIKVKTIRGEKENTPFLKDLRSITLKSKKSFVFFVAFSFKCC